MVLLAAHLSIAFQDAASDRLVKNLRTPVPFTVADEQIKVGRERIVREARRNPSETFKTRLLQAQRTRLVRDIVFAIAAGYETTPRYVASTSEDYTRLLALIRQRDPGQSLEYRRATYVMEANVSLAPVTESSVTDPDGKIRRALLDAYPEDPFVWLAASKDVMYVSRYVGIEDARRVAAWWERWTGRSDASFPARLVAEGRMRTLLGIALYSKSKDDAQRMESAYRAWAKLVPPSQKDDVKFFGDAVKGVKRLVK